MRYKKIIATVIAACALALNVSEPAWAFPGYSISNVCVTGAHSVTFTQEWETSGGVTYVRPRKATVNANNLGSPMTNTYVLYKYLQNGLHQQEQWWYIGTLWNGTLVADAYNVDANMRTFRIPSTQEIKMSLIFNYNGGTIECPANALIQG